MALPVLDGNQTATTLSSVVTGGEHIVAHSVVSLGSTAIANITSAVSGSVVSISNFPSTQTIAGTVTANAGTELGTTGNNYGFIALGVDDVGTTNPLSLDGSAHLLIAGTVTVGNSVTIGSLPAISGTVTANVASVVTINSSGANFSQRVVSKSALQFTAIAGAIDPTRFSSDYTVLPVKITSETDGLNLAVDLRKTVQGNDLSAISNDATAAFVRTQVVGGSVTIGSLPAISGTVTANVDASSLISALDNFGEAYTNQIPVGIDQTGFGDVPISGTVTAAAPNGSLTTRFGTPTTANTAFATSAVTNANRKYLLIQNVTTGSNVITVGIGFTPTTTQGIQLTAGAGITFESSYIPTGQIFVLSSVTASNFTILEA